MKTNKFLNSFIYFVLAFVIFAVEQATTLFVGVSQIWQILLLALVILLVCGATLYIAKRVGLLQGFKALGNSRALKTIFLGFLVLYLVKMLGGIVLVLEGVTNTGNQEIIESAGMHPLILTLFTAVVAPIVEETVFRGLLMGRVFNSQSVIGLLISSFLFGLIHVPTTIGAWILYGGMGLVLGWIYRKTEKLEYTIAIHFLNNALAVALMFVLTLLT